MSVLLALATDAARAGHEIDDDFVGDSYYEVTAEIVVGHLRNGVVFEDLQRRTHTGR